MNYYKKIWILAFIIVVLIISGCNNNKISNKKEKSSIDSANSIKFKHVCDKISNEEVERFCGIKNITQKEVLFDKEGYGTCSYRGEKEKPKIITNEEEQEFNFNPFISIVIPQNNFNIVQQVRSQNYEPGELEELKNIGDEAVLTRREAMFVRKNNKNFKLETSIKKGYCSIEGFKEIAKLFIQRAS